ncbi:trace amine-associated receptor 13c-like [Erpetoichthys calabaricus]|uniref:trace amine-associated receptor 13c-like n=1 Tax=Erpetoichthys calabaricus TaxID=27687 RepID=UPI00109FF773|nr:trace amine-associated receptor 13c-like [Erpetoichthys calabaricus]
MEMNSTFLPSNSVEYCYQNLTRSCIRVSRSSNGKTVLYCVLVMIMLTNVLGNLVVIASISHFKQLHSPHNLLVLSLATADLLLGLLVLPFSMIRTVETCWYFGPDICRTHSSVDLFFCTVSIFHLGFIAVDRYFAVCDSLRYSSKMNNKVISYIILTGWILAAIYSYGSIHSKSNDEGLLSTVPMMACEGSCLLLFNKLWSIVDILTFVLPCSAMVVIYARIYSVAKSQARKIQNMDIKSQTTEESQAGKKRKLEQKAAKTLGIVMGAFLACWVPYFTTTVVDAFYNYQTPAVIFDGFIWLAYTNSAFNPLIYGFFYPGFRKALRIIITCRIFHNDSSLFKLYAE